MGIVGLKKRVICYFVVVGCWKKKGVGVGS